MSRQLGEAMRLFAHPLKRLADPFGGRFGNIAHSDILVTYATNGSAGGGPVSPEMHSELSVLERLTGQLFISNHRSDNGQFAALVLASNDHHKFGIASVNFL